MLKPRYYQREAVDSIFEYWGEEPGNPLVVMATGTGKSLSMSTLIRELLEGWADMRVLCATHVAELIEQNYLELVGIWPFAPAGIFSAGLKRREADAQVLFAGIQTVHNKAQRIGKVDVLLIDEAHLVPPNSATMYGRFIKALLEINPDMKIVGFTATDYRLDSGRLTEGSNALFDTVVYNYGIAEGIADGYLSPLSTKAVEFSGYDLKGVGKQGGDYKAGALQAAVDKSGVTIAAVNEMVEKGANRKSWLCFCSGVEHALHVRDEIRRRGITCETITGETPKEERRRILEAYKRYEIRALTNNSVLTTGFNHKGVDLLAFMRPTLSTSLYVQMAGRGTRAVYPAGFNEHNATREERVAAIAGGPKPNCLVLDFARLIYTHGPVDRVDAKEPTKGEGEAPVKQCPECDALIHISVMKCHECGHEFPPSEEKKFTSGAASAPILSGTEPDWEPVGSRTYRRHPAKVEGNPPSVKCTYSVDGRAVNEWICPQHHEHPNPRSRGFPTKRAAEYWRKHQGAEPVPQTVDEFLDRAGELFETKEVLLDYRRNPKYPEVRGYRVGDAPPAVSAGNLGGRGLATVMPDLQRKPSPGMAELAEFDDEIPF